MTVNLSYFAGAGWQFFDDNGIPLSGGKIYSYIAGTTTPAVTYTSNSGFASNPNPIILDAAGRPTEEVWLTPGVSYKFVLKTSTDVTIRTYDNLGSINDFSEFANTSDPTLGDALVGFRQSNSAGNLNGSVGRTVHEKFQELISVKDFGAVGNGTTNDTAAIQAGINACSANGNALYFPPGKYLVTNLTLQTVSLIGTGVMDNGTPYGNAGSVLCQTDTTQPMLTVAGGVTISGMSFFYPSQINGSILPTAYQPTIFGSATQSVTNLNIINSIFINSYDCINLTQGTQAHGRVTLSNIQAYAINKFMYLSGVADVVTCLNCQVTVGNFQDVATPSSVLRGYTQANGIGFDLAGRVDGLTVNSSIIYGYKSAFRSLSGTPDFLKVINCNLDSVINGVEIGGTSQITSCVIEGNAFIGSNPFDAASPTYGIKIASTANISDFIIANNSFSFSGRDSVNIQAGSTDRVLIDGNKFSYYGKATGLTVDGYGVYAEDGSDFIITNNLFITNYVNGVGIGINGNVSVIEGNIFDNNKFSIDILGGVNYVISNNLAKNTITKCLKITTAPTKLVQSANYWDQTSDLVCGVTDTYNWGTITSPFAATRSVTVPGVDANDVICLGLSTSPLVGAGIVYSAYVSAVNTVTVVAANYTGSSVVVGSQTMNIYVAPRF